MSTRTWLLLFFGLSWGIFVWVPTQPRLELRRVPAQERVATTMPVHPVIVP